MRSRGSISRSRLSTTISYVSFKKKEEFCFFHIFYFYTCLFATLKLPPFVVSRELENEAESDLWKRVHAPPIPSSQVSLPLVFHKTHQQSPVSLLFSIFLPVIDSAWRRSTQVLSTTVHSLRFRCVNSRNFLIPSVFHRSERRISAIQSLELERSREANRPKVRVGFF